LTYFAYNILLALLAPLLVPYLLLRGRLKGQAWSSLSQRLGTLPVSFHQTGSNAIWLHAVSVGEVASCAELIRTLRRRFPKCPIFVSTTTVSGQKLARERLAGVVDGIFHAPIDLPFAVRRVLFALRPRLVIVAETEIWPNLFREVKRFGASLLLLNARISDRTLPRYRNLRFFFAPVLANADLILAQSAQDQERLLQAGAPADRLRIGGNLKYDFDPADAPLHDDLKTFLSRHPAASVIVAGSTREGEEAPVLEAFREVASRQPRALLVLAPRHPSRWDEVAGMLSAGGLPFVRRSELASDASAAFSLPGVLLLDTLGELASLYPLADVVFVGGSLNGWGGHNVLEPALAGKPVVVGPTMQNFQAIADELLRREALVQVESAHQLPAALLSLLGDRETSAAIGSRGREAAQAQRGATETAAREAQRLHGLATPCVPPQWFEYAALWLPMLLWSAMVRARAWCFQHGWLQSRRLRTFTLCVGNLTAGGAGKTPMVLWLVEQLHKRGYQTTVLLRGYRRVSPESQTVARPGLPISPLRSGDEAQVLLRHFEEQGLAVPVGIGAERAAVGNRIEEEQPLDAVILDDGFQHLQLKRQFDLVLVDSTQSPGGDHLLPLGRLREPVSGIRRASAIVLTRTEPGQSYEGLEQQLKRLNPGAPLFRSRTRLLGAVEAATSADATIDSLRLRRALGFCGVGNPQSFWRGLEQEGVQLVHRMRFRDHHIYAPLDVRNIVLAARHEQAEILLTTEKDLVNLWHAADSARSVSTNLGATVAELFHPLLIYWIRIATEIEKGEDLVAFIEERMAVSKAPVSAASAPLADAQYLTPSRNP
jgi:3-deoxy-D-manno-octulosonic-acid transferase